MQRTRSVLIALPVAAIVLLGGWAALPSTDSEPAAIDTSKPPSTRGPIVAVATFVDFDEQFEIAAEAARVAAYLAELEAARLEAERQAALQRAAEAAAAARQAAAVPTIRTANGSGPHSDAWWWGVAICEQGGRNDPYFGYFSWMDGSAGGLTWEQQVAKSNALLSRVSSESPAWAASCVAAGYRASPGG